MKRKGITRSTPAEYAYTLAWYYAGPATETNWNAMCRLKRQRRWIQGALAQGRVHAKKQREEARA